MFKALKEGLGRIIYGETLSPEELVHQSEHRYRKLYLGLYRKRRQTLINFKFVEGKSSHSILVPVTSFLHFADFLAEVSGQETGL